MKNQAQAEIELRVLSMNNAAAMLVMHSRGEVQLSTEQRAELKRILGEAAAPRWAAAE